MNDRERERVKTEAIARITWGDSPSDVRAWLISEQLPRDAAEELLRDCVRRRAREMRTLGLRNLMRALAALAGGAILGLGGWLLTEWLLHNGVDVPGRMFALFFAPAMLLIGFGSYQSWLAVDRLAFGAWADGAVTDLE